MNTIKTEKEKFVQCDKTPWFTPGDLSNIPLMLLLQNKLSTARIRKMREGNIVSLCSHLRGGGGYPHPSWWGVPLPRSGWGKDRGCPHLAGGGYPIRSGWGYLPYPHEGWGYPCPDLGRGVPPIQNWEGVPRSPACTCYAAGGMPLAFTQEDFLVFR